MELRKLTIGERVKSFGCAAAGLAAVVGSQPNTWYMALATAGVVAAGLWFQVNVTEWCFLVTAVFVVWIAEVMNSAIEFLTDLASPGIHPLAKKAKDAAAGAVLLAVVFSLAIAAFVFIPKLL
ncbi:MAG: diacylglycerol kinase family protein [Nitrospiraceae bacterium]|nr:diacylglycerol kinase family protein [Nitrospiraceae bacterium]